MQQGESDSTLVPGIAFSLPEVGCTAAVLGCVIAKLGVTPLLSPLAANDGHRLAPPLYAQLPEIVIRNHPRQLRSFRAAIESFIGISDETPVSRP
jgi:hypothetical protein